MEPRAGSRASGGSACTVLLGGKARGRAGAGARVVAGPVPLRPRGGPGAARGGGLGRPGQHPGPLQRHGVVRRLPGGVRVGVGEVGDGDAHVSRRGGRRLPVAALLPRCGRERQGAAVSMGGRGSASQATCAHREGRTTKTNSAHGERRVGLCAGRGAPNPPRTGSSPAAQAKLSNLSTCNSHRVTAERLYLSRSNQANAQPWGLLETRSKGNRKAPSPTPATREWCLSAVPSALPAPGARRAVLLCWAIYPHQAENQSQVTFKSWASLRKIGNHNKFGRVVQKMMQISKLKTMCM